MFYKFNINYTDMIPIIFYVIHRYFKLSTFFSPFSIYVLIKCLCLNTKELEF